MSIWLFRAGRNGEYESQTFLDKCDSDFIIFNYGFKEPGVYIKDDRITYKECTDEYKIIYNKSKFRDADFLNENCCTAWNKWIKREIVNQIFIPVKKDKKVSCNEDVYLCSAALNKSKSVQLMPHYIYINRPDRGNSNNFIDSFENFEKIIQGWKESLDLFKYEFPKSCNLFDYEEKRKSDIAYFLNRYYNCDDSIKEKVINRILEVCTKKEILNVLNDRYSGFLENALTGFIISIGKIVSANTKALTRLEDSINRLDKTLEKQGKNIDSLEQEVNEHETRISVLEHK